MMIPDRLNQDCKELVLLGVLLGILWETGCAQIHYSVPEELEKGSRVGNIAEDLGLEPQELEERGIRIVSRGRTQLFALNLRSGSLISAALWLPVLELSSLQAVYLQSSPQILSLQEGIW